MAERVNVSGQSGQSGGHNPACRPLRKHFLDCVTPRTDARTRSTAALGKTCSARHYGYSSRVLPLEDDTARLEAGPAQSR